MTPTQNQLQALWDTCSAWVAKAPPREGDGLGLALALLEEAGLTATFERGGIMGFPSTYFSQGFNITPDGKGFSAVIPGEPSPTFPSLGAASQWVVKVQTHRALIELEREVRAIQQPPLDTKGASDDIPQRIRNQVWNWAHGAFVSGQIERDLCKALIAEARQVRTHALNQAATVAAEYLKGLLGVNSYLPEAIRGLDSVTGGTESSPK